MDKLKRLEDRATIIENGTKKSWNLVAIVAVVALGICFLLWCLQNSPQSSLVENLLGGIFVLFFFGYGFLGLAAEGVSSVALRHNPEFKTLIQTIKENIPILEDELKKFDEMKKEYAQYWLSMDGWQFEREVAKLYRARGYDAVVTKGSGRWRHRYIANKKMGLDLACSVRIGINLLLNLLFAN